MHFPALPSAMAIALGKGGHFTECPDPWHSAKNFFKKKDTLPSVWTKRHSAKNLQKKEKRLC
jgi:hypothetical protein